MSDNDIKNSDVETMSFEQAMSELENIVTKLEKGDVELEKSIEIYERGEALKKHSRTLLDRAEKRIEKIRLDRSGSLQGTETLDPE